jgi:hypothetical protein
MKRSGKTLALFLLSFFVISLLSTSLVPAPDHSTTDSARAAVSAGAQQTTTLGERLFGPLVKSSTGLSDEAKASIAKILLTILVVIFVYAISTYIPVFPKEQPSIRWIFAIIVGVLGFLFIKPEEIAAITKPYEALGVALTIVIPLIILITFTVRLREENKKIAAVVNKPLMIIFFIYVMYQWISLAIPDNSPNPAWAWAYPIGAVLSLIWGFWLEKKVSNAIEKAESNAEQESALNVVDDAVGGVEAAAKLKKSLANLNAKVKK